MALADRVAALARGEKRFSVDTWISDYLIPAGTFGYGGMRYPYGTGAPGLTQTLGGLRISEIANTLPGYAAALRGCPPAFAAQMVRALVLSQVRFTFRNLPSNRSTPRRTFGTTALSPLERPDPGANVTTGEMIARMEWHAGLAGNAYVYRRPDKLMVLRPDWVGVVWGSDREPEDPGFAIDRRLVGYVYQNGGLWQGGNKPTTILPVDMCHWCVDEETEILTAEGWKDFRGLAVDDEVLTLNHETGLSEWQPVLEVCVFPAKRREMVLMEGNEFSSLTTPNHRWPVEYRISRRKTYGRRWVTSASIGAGDRIPAAAYSVLPTEQKWTDALVEAVAWFWTEGRFNSGSRPGRRGRGISIAQSHKNVDNCQRIRGALTSLFGPAVERIPKQGPRAGVPACWVESRDDDMAIFRLSANGADVITEHAPGKVVTTKFLRSLTLAQLDLFIKISLLADNCGPTRLAQKSPAMAEQFALACILAGHAVSIRPGARKFRGYRMTNVRILTKRHVYPQEGMRSASKFRVERVDYDGHVWCPRTANETWLARRRGSVYFTGNSPLPDPEMPGLGMSWLTPAIRDIQGDRAASDHKLMFWANGATPNLVIKGIAGPNGQPLTKTQFDEIVEMLEARHTGVANAFRTLYLTAGADATVVGSNFQQMDLKAIQGASETRIAFLSRVPAPLLGIAEGLAGSSLNAGNFGMARRIFADSWVYPTLQDLCGALSTIIDVPRDAELWFDTTDMPILREDGKDSAEIEQIKATTITMYVREGFTAESAIAAVKGQDVTLLKHSGLTSVQLQEPGKAPPATNGKPAEVEAAA